MRIVYLLAGLAGAFLFYSGNLLWIESRRKTRQAEQPRVHRLLAQATVGVCIGTCIGVALCFPAALLWPERAVSYVFWPVFLLAVGWSLVRPPVRGQPSSCCDVAALASLTVPLANALLTGDHFIVAALHGRWGVAGFDIGAIALAVGYWCWPVLPSSVRTTARRNRSGRCVRPRPSRPRSRPCARPTRPDVPASSPRGETPSASPSAQVLLHRLFQVRDQVA